MSEGNLGLIKAVERYDWRKSCRFSTYATPWIQQAISRGIADRSRSIRVPVHIHERIGKVKTCSRKFLLEQGAEPTVTELAKALCLKEEQVKEALYAGMEPVSLNTPVKKDDSKYSLMDFTMDPRTSDLAQSTFEEQRNLILEEAMNHTLTKREMDILKWRSGMYDGRIWTLEEIGQVLKLTRERIRQIEKKALGKLRRSSELKEVLDAGS